MVSSSTGQNYHQNMSIELKKLHGNPLLPSTKGTLLDANRKTVQLFERLAAWIWTTIPSAANEGVSWGEQTLTEHLLLEIKCAKLPNVWIRQYPPDPMNAGTKLREDVTGLDWEWWIGSDRRRWLRFAVQAKKLDLKSQRYEKLKHMVGTVAQHDILARYAEDNEAIPLYCLYNYVQNLDAGQGWQCCINSGRPEQLGCTLTPLIAVREALEKRGKRTFAYFHSQPSTIPWRCLVKCPNLRPIIDNHWGGCNPKDHLPAEIESLRHEIQTASRGPGSDSLMPPTPDHQVGHMIRPRHVMVVELAEDQCIQSESEPLPPHLNF
jgi:hypothetical protein